MKLQKATIEDIQDIREIYSFAREFMRKTGNPNQWGSTSPAEELLIGDIANGNLYLVLSDENELLGSFAFIPGPDPTYAYIEDGAWLNVDEYYVIHRVASNGKAKGIMHFALEEGFKKTKNIRIDTHEDNKVMQNLLAKEGFERCGIIYLANGDPRIAFQKSIK